MASGTLEGGRYVVPANPTPEQLQTTVIGDGDCCPPDGKVPRPKFQYEDVVPYRSRSGDTPPATKPAEKPAEKGETKD